MTDSASQKKNSNQTPVRLSDNLVPESASKLSLEDRLRLTFEKLGYPQLNAIQCSADGDQMKLSGELASFYLKQVAQSVAVKIPGVRIVHNEIEVR